MIKNAKKLIVVLLLAAFALSAAGCSATDYSKAAKLMESGDYTAAESMFAALGDYKDSAEQASECNYQLADAAFDAEEYETAQSLYASLADYKDSAELSVRAGDLAIGKKLVGSWTSGEIDITEDFMDDFVSTLEQQGSAELVQYFDFGKITFLMKFIYTENGTFALTLDEQQLNSTIDGLCISIRTGFTNYIESLYQQVAAENDLTLGELMEVNEAKSVEDLFVCDFDVSIGEFVESFLPRELLASLLGTLNLNGTYTVENGTVAMTIGTDTKHAEYDAASDALIMDGAGLTGEDIIFTRS